MAGLAVTVLTKKIYLILKNPYAKKITNHSKTV